MLVKLRSKMGQVFLSNAIENKDMQVAIPNIEMEKLEQNFGVGTKVLQAIAYIIIALSFASLFISVVDNVRSRRHELALMRTMGGKPLSMFLLLILEGGCSQRQALCSD